MTLEAVIDANLPDLNHTAKGHLLGVIQGLLSVMNPADRSVILKAATGNALASSAIRIAENAASIDQGHQEVEARHKSEQRVKRDAEMFAPDPQREALVRLLRANVTSAEAVAAAAVLLRGSDRISELWAWYDGTRRQAAPTAGLNADQILLRSNNSRSGGYATDAESGSSSSIVTPAPRVISMGRYERVPWYNDPYSQSPWQADAAPSETPHRASPAVVEAFARQLPGAVVDARRNTVLAPGVGEIALIGNQSVIIAKPEDLARERKERQQIADEAIRLGGVPRPDGTIALQNGAVIRLRPEKGMTEIVKSAQETRQAEEATRRQVEKQIVAEAGATPPHVYKTPITPSEAATIRREVQKDQEGIGNQKSIDQRDRQLAGVLAAGQTPDTAPAPVPERSWKGWALDVAITVVGPTKSGERLRRVTDVDTSNPVVAGMAERETSRSWNNILAGGIRKTWNTAQDATATLMGTEKSPAERAREQHATAVWARGLVEQLLPTAKTEVEAQVEAAAAERARTTSNPANLNPDTVKSTPVSQATPAVQAVPEPLAMSVKATNPSGPPSVDAQSLGSPSVGRQALSKLYPKNQSTIAELKERIAEKERITTLASVAPSAAKPASHEKPSEKTVADAKPATTPLKEAAKETESPAKPIVKLTAGGPR